MRVGETDLAVCAERDLSDLARSLTREARAELIGYGERDAAFLDALRPVEIHADAPPLVTAMANAARRAGPGPMAAVAGAIAERVGRGLLGDGGNGPGTNEVIVENGGDVFLKSAWPRRVAVFAGGRALSMKLALEIAPDETPLGVATSSATVGPSMSFGKADAAGVLSPDVALADAVATALANRVRAAGDMEPALAWALGVEGVRGALVVLGDRFAARGEVRLAEGG